MSTAIKYNLGKPLYVEAASVEWVEETGIATGLTDTSESFKMT
jgi:uncharacterized surface protein with fasciclin (FAS1) repeats